MRLEGKTAVITGAGRGIGKAVALAFAREGADVVVVEVDQDAGQETAQEIQALDRRSISVQTDVSDRDQVDDLVKTTLEQFGRIDIWVNNAGIIRPAMLHKMKPEQWQEVINVHLNGAFNCLQAAAKVMMEQKSGKIINVVSAAGISGTIGQINYSSAKAGIIGLTKSAAKELGKHGINVNAISPGVVEGDHWDNVDSLFAKHEKRPLGEKKRLVGEAVPYGRMGRAEDLTGMAVFLASSESDYVVAQTYNVDGGNWMS